MQYHWNSNLSGIITLQELPQNVKNVLCPTLGVFMNHSIPDDKRFMECVILAEL